MDLIPKYIFTKILVNLEIEDFKSLRETSKFFQKKIDTIEFWKNFYSLSFGQNLEKEFKKDELSKDPVGVWNKLTKEKSFWNRLVNVHFEICNKEKWPEKIYYEPQSYPRVTNIPRTNMHLLKIYLKLRGIDIIPGVCYRKIVNYGEWHGYTFIDVWHYLNTHLMLFRYERENYCWKECISQPYSLTKDMATILLRKPSKKFFQRMQNILYIFSKVLPIERNKYSTIQESYANHILEHIDKLLYKEQQISNMVNKIKDLKRIIDSLEIKAFISKHASRERLKLVSDSRFKNTDCKNLVHNFITELMEK